MSREREALLRLYGARVEIVESLGGMNEAVDGRARDGRAATTSSCPTSSPTRPTPRPTPRHRARDLRRRSTAASTSSSPASGPAARSPASARSSRSATRTCTSSPSSRRRSRALRPHARAAPHPGHRRRVRPGRARPRACSTRSSAVRDDDAIATRARARPHARASSPGCRCGAALCGALEVARRPESQGKRIVVRPARLGRALHQRALVRARVDPLLDAAATGRSPPPTLRWPAPGSRIVSRPSALRPSSASARVAGAVRVVVGADQDGVRSRRRRPRRARHPSGRSRRARGPRRRGRAGRRARRGRRAARARCWRPRAATARSRASGATTTRSPGPAGELDELRVEARAPAVRARRSQSGQVRVPDVLAALAQPLAPARSASGSGPMPCQPWRMSARAPDGTGAQRRHLASRMLGLGTLRARRRRDPPRRRGRPRARPGRARRLLARDPRRAGPASTRCSPTASPTRCTRPACRSSRGRSPTATRALTGIEIHPAARDRRRALHRPRHGRRRRRDRGDRRRRDALPGRHARRHRLCHRQAPPDGRGQRDDRLRRQAARADHRSATARRSAPTPSSSPTCRRTPPSSATPATSVRVDGKRPEGPGRRLDPPARPGRRRDQGPAAPHPRARARGSPTSQDEPEPRGGRGAPAAPRSRGPNPAGG